MSRPCPAPAGCSLSRLRLAAARRQLRRARGVGWGGRAWRVSRERAMQGVSLKHCRCLGRCVCHWFAFKPALGRRHATCAGCPQASSCLYTNQEWQGGARSGSRGPTISTRSDATASTDDVRRPIESVDIAPVPRRSPFLQATRQPSARGRGGALPMAPSRQRRSRALIARRYGKVGCRSSIVPRKIRIASGNWHVATASSSFEWCVAWRPACWAPSELGELGAAGCLATEGGLAS